MSSLTPKRLALRLQRLSLAGIAVGLAGLMALVVCVMLGHHYNRQLRNSTLEFGRSNAVMLARVLEDQVERVLVALGKSMHQADLMVTPEISPEEATEMLRQLDLSRAVRSISMIDAGGRVLASSNPGALGMTLDAQLLKTLPLANPLNQPGFSTVWAGYDLVDARVPEEILADGQGFVGGGGNAALPVVMRARISGRYILAILSPKYLVARHQQILGNAYDSTRIYSLEGRLLLQTNLRNAELGVLQSDDPLFSTYIKERAIGDYLEAETENPVAYRASEMSGSVIKVEIAAAQLFERAGNNGGAVELASFFAGVLLFLKSIGVGIGLGVSKRRGLALKRSNARLAIREAELRGHRDQLTNLVKQRTAHLERATQEAEQANRAKSEFLANMSHELRTPMHAILSFSQFGLDRLSRTPDGRNDKMERYFTNIHASGQRLLDLLNDLLDLSKLEAGRMEIRKQPCCLQEIAIDVAEEMRTMLQEADLQCHVHATPAAQGGSVNADAARLRQVVHNLMGNALKFTPAGGAIRVEIDCGPSRTNIVASHSEFDDFSLDDTGHAAEVAILRVIDNGVGIPADELDLIFDKFAQSSTTKTGSGGTGLGLAICREIVGAHGGSIRAYNNPQGSGAVFEVELPFETTACLHNGAATQADAAAPAAVA